MQWRSSLPPSIWGSAQPTCQHERCEDAATISTAPLPKKRARLHQMIGLSFLAVSAVRAGATARAPGIEGFASGRRLSSGPEQDEALTDPATSITWALHNLRLCWRINGVALPNISVAKQSCIDIGPDCWGIYDSGCDQGQHDIYLCSGHHHKESEDLLLSSYSCVYEKVLPTTTSTTLSSTSSTSWTSSSTSVSSETTTGTSGTLTTSTNTSTSLTDTSTSQTSTTLSTPTETSTVTDSTYTATSLTTATLTQTSSSATSATVTSSTTTVTSITSITATSGSSTSTTTLSTVTGTSSLTTTTTGTTASATSTVTASTSSTTVMTVTSVSTSTTSFTLITVSSSVISTSTISSASSLLPSTSTASSTSQALGFELTFDAPYDEIDSDAFQAELLGSFRGLGAEESILAALVIHLRKGSIIASIQGPVLAIVEMAELPLEQVEVMGYVGTLSSPPDLEGLVGFGFVGSCLSVLCPGTHTVRDNLGSIRCAGATCTLAECCETTVEDAASASASSWRRCGAKGLEVDCDVFWVLIVCHVILFGIIVTLCLRFIKPWPQLGNLGWLAEAAKLRCLKLRLPQDAPSAEREAQQRDPVPVQPVESQLKDPWEVVFKDAAEMLAWNREALVWVADAKQYGLLVLEAVTVDNDGRRVPSQWLLERPMVTADLESLSFPVQLHLTFFQGMQPCCPDCNAQMEWSACSEWFCASCKKNDICELCDDSPGQASAGPRAEHGEDLGKALAGTPPPQHRGLRRAATQVHWPRWSSRADGEEAGSQSVLVHSSSGADTPCTTPASSSGCSGEDHPGHADVKRALDKEVELYLPKVVSGDPVLIPEAENTWRADNSVLRASTRGLCFRNSQALYDKADAILTWGESIRGADVGDGWVKYHVQVPAYLMLITPHLQQACAGRYVIVEGSQVNGVNGHPLWCQESGYHILYSGLNGKWCFGGRDNLKQGFACSAGYIYHSHKHYGTMPHKMDQLAWRYWDEAENTFQDCPSICICSCEGPAPPPATTAVAVDEGRGGKSPRKARFCSTREGSPDRDGFADILL